MSRMLVRGSWLGGINGYIERMRVDALPPSTNLSSICLWTVLDDSRSEIRDWYLPSWAVLKDPMASAGPLDGVAAAVGGGASLWRAGDMVDGKKEWTVQSFYIQSAPIPIHFVITVGRFASGLRPRVEFDGLLIRRWGGRGFIGAGSSVGNRPIYYIKETHEHIEQNTVQYTARVSSMFRKEKDNRGGCQRQRRKKTTESAGAGPAAAQAHRGLQVVGPCTAVRASPRPGS